MNHFKEQNIKEYHSVIKKDYGRYLIWRLKYLKVGVQLYQIKKHLLYTIKLDRGVLI
jgi:hypothetical protein